MNRKYQILTGLLLLVCLLLIPSRVSAGTGAYPFDKIVFGGNYTLSNGETLDGTLAMFGGNATIEQDAKVDGDILMLGGNLEMDGTVTGNIVTFGGSVSLEKSAVVEGDINTFGGAINRENGSQVQGRVTRGERSGLNFDLPTPTPGMMPDLWNGLHPLWDFSMFMARSLAMAALAMLITLAAPRATDTVAVSSFANPILSGGLGLLTVLVAPIVIVVLAITILLIPISLIFVLLLAAACIFGYTAIGLEVGKRLEAWLKGSWSAPLSAGLGTFVLLLAVGLINLIPCVGWILGAGVGLVGLGAVILTRFGTTPYNSTHITAPVTANPTPQSGPAQVIDVQPSAPTQQPPDAGEGSSSNSSGQ